MTLLNQINRVKLGQNIETSDFCAIKIIKDVSSIEKLEQFMNEVRLLSQCNHKHVIAVSSVSVSGILMHHSGMKRQIVYHVTQFVKFGEVFEIIRETGYFGEKVARTFFLQLLQGLEYLHSIGIAHRDIKPENLLFDDKFQLKIADFGSAAKYKNEAKEEIQFDSSIVVGSQEYNAPEMNMDKIYSGERADIFSAGVCLFLMVTGQAPFREASCRDDYYRLLAKKDKTSYWNIYAKTIELSSDFKDIFEKMTERNIIKRISIKELLNHPWIKGQTLNEIELGESLKTRLEIYHKIRLNAYEKKESDKLHIRKIHFSSIIEKAIQLDILYPNYCLECKEINDRIIKNKKLIIPPQDDKLFLLQSQIKNIDD